jgi:hypothetical protein
MLFDQSENRYALEQSEPPPPLVNLVATLPPQSANWLPQALAYLMTGENSELIQFLPRTFAVDLGAEGGGSTGRVISVVPDSYCSGEFAARSMKSRNNPARMQRAVIKSDVK